MRLLNQNRGNLSTPPRKALEPIWHKNSVKILSEFKNNLLESIGNSAFWGLLIIFWNIEFNILGNFQSIFR